MDDYRTIVDAEAYQPPLLRDEEVADALGISVAQLLELRRAGHRLICVSRPGSRYGFTEWKPNSK